MAGATQGTVLASLITFSPQVLFTGYLQTLSYSAALFDQQMGGTIMMLSGPIVYGIAAAIVMRNNIDDVEKDKPNPEIYQVIKGT